MMMNRSKKITALPSAEYLKECFEYDGETGFLTWKHRPERHFKDTHQWRIFNSKYGGKTVSRKFRANGRLSPVCILYKNFDQTRIILAMNGIEVPTGMVVDHINGNPLDNRLVNLRVCTQQQNSFNSRSKGALLRGVRRNRAKHVVTYGARIKVDGVEIHLGNYPTKGLAAVVYAKACLRYFGRYACFSHDSRLTLG